MISVQAKRYGAALCFAVLAGLLVAGLLTAPFGATGLLHARQETVPPKTALPKTAPQEVDGQHLLTKPLAGEPGKEVDIQVYTFPPESAVPWHIHRGAHEFEYGLEGTLMIEEEGKAPYPLKAGGSNYLAPDVVHRGWNPSKTEPAKIYVIRIKPAGAPLATIVDGKKGNSSAPDAGAYPEDAP